VGAILQSAYDTSTWHSVVLFCLEMIALWGPIIQFIYLFIFIYENCILFIYLSLLCWVGVYCGIYKSFYNIPNMSYLNSLPPPFSFISSPLPHSWNSFNRYHFSFTYKSTQYLYHIHPPSPFPHLLTLPLVATPPTLVGPVLPSCSLILSKKKRKRKRWHLLLR
jgi:hypothetical protein